MPGVLHGAPARQQAAGELPEALELQSADFSGLLPRLGHQGRAVFHMIDELTDYEIAALEFDPGSTWITEVVRNRWYSTFGPPDELVTDGGHEFCGAMQRLNDLFA